MQTFNSFVVCLANTKHTMCKMLVFALPFTKTRAFLSIKDDVVSLGVSRYWSWPTFSQLYILSQLL